MQNGPPWKPCRVIYIVATSSLQRALAPVVVLGFFYELVKYVTRRLQSPVDDPNLAAFSKESDKEGALSISDPDAWKRIWRSDPAPNHNP